MIIGIMSDSHDNLPNIRKALALFAAAGATALIHTGDFVSPFAVKEILKFDGPSYGVFGNNDGEIAGLKKLWPGVNFAPFLLELAGLRILITHDAADFERVRYDRIDVRIFGHNHKPEIRPGTPLEINPGETGGWLYGKPTCAVLDTYGPSARILEID